MTRTSMYASTGSEMALLADGLLADLCFLDDRDADYERAHQELLGRYGKLGVPGPFRAMFDLEQCQAEVAAVYAEVFSRLGYLKVEHPLSQARWDELTTSLPALLADQDMRRGEAEVRLGPPSLIVGRKILCYASPRSAEGWIFVDCHDEHSRAYDVSTGRYEVISSPEPIIRSARRSAGSFEDGLILTPYGKTLRWGEGWWIDHPSPDWAPKTLAIAAQLRQIRDVDPSQQPN